MKRIISVFITIMLVMEMSTYEVYANEELLKLANVQQKHYVIYENSAENRIEATIFDITDNNEQSILFTLPLMLVYGGSDIVTGDNGNLALIDNSKLGNCEHYYFNENKWIYFGSNAVIGENVATLIKSDLPYFEVLGKENPDILRRSFVNDKCLYAKAGTVYVSISDGIHDFKQLEFDYNFPEGYIAENYITNVEDFVYGNNLYVIVGFEDYYDPGSESSEVYLEKYKTGSHSNSPIHIFDANFNLIDTVDYQGCFDIEFFYDGYFYLKHRDYTNVTAFGGNRTDTYYKSADIKNRIEISKEEYDSAKTFKKSILKQNTMGGYNIEQNKLIDKTTQKEYNIIREESKYNGATYNNGNLAYCYFYDSEDKRLLATDISIDGVYGVTLPTFTKGQYGGKTNYTWSTNQYIYIDPIYMDCIYRLPISQLRDKTIVRLNDKILGFSQPPVMEDDRTLVPMRFLFEQMGADVNWNDATQTVTATISSARGGGGERNRAGELALTIDSKAKPLTASMEDNTNSVTFSIDNTTATVNGQTRSMDVPARLINDQTFVPLRFLSENLGYDVQWDESTNTAIITTE